MIPGVAGGVGGGEGREQLPKQQTKDGDVTDIS